MSEDELLLPEELWSPRLVIESLRRQTDKVASRAIKNKKWLNMIRDLLEGRSEPPLIRKVVECRKGYCVIAVDTSFTAPPLELVGGRLGIINRALTMYGDCPHTYIDLASHVEFTGGEEYMIRFASKIIERKAILDKLIKKKRREEDFDIILIDGELVPRIPPGLTGRRASERPAYKRLMKILELTKKIYELAHETETPLVGIIKRAYGIDLVIMLGLTENINDKDFYEKSLNDKVIATYLLESNEWIEIGSYRMILEALRTNTGVVKDIRRLDEKRKFLESLEEILGDSAGEIFRTRLALYKSITPTYFSIATKIEIYPVNRDPSEIIGYLARTTTVNGVPLPIDIVDRMAAVKKSQIYVTQQQFYLELVKKIGDEKLARSIAGLTNPEKMRVAGFRQYFRE